MYQREYLFELTPSPDTEDLPLIAKWPEIGLGPVTTQVPIVGDRSRYCIIVANVQRANLLLGRPVTE